VSWNSIYCWTVLYCTEYYTMYCTEMYCIVQYTILCTILYILYSMLYYVLYWTVLVLYCTKLYWTVLYCLKCWTIQCTVLYYNVLCCSGLEEEYNMFFYGYSKEQQTAAQEYQLNTRSVFIYSSIYYFVSFMFVHSFFTYLFIW